jgi:hypothetical protein
VGNIDQNAVNLHYIRAAIEANTGIRLDLKKVRQYLVEEKLLTPVQARKYAQVFSGYQDFYEDSTMGPLPRSEEPEDLTGFLERLSR